MSSHSTTTGGLLHGTDKKLDIVIVGGSLGGLCAGLALKSLGHKITILERNPSPLLHDQGTGIVAGGDTLSFFKKYDRTGRQMAVSSQRRQYLNKEGEVIHREDMVQNMTSWDLTYYILRANFDRIESAYCKAPEESEHDGNVRHLHGHKVTGVKEKDDKVVVTYTTNEGKEGSMTADFVVGADGPSSTIRSVFEPNVARTYAGYVAFRGTIREEETSPETYKAFSERFTFFHTQGIQILAYLIPGVNGTMEPGKRLINFVYYTNFPLIH